MDISVRPEQRHHKKQRAPAFLASLQAHPLTGAVSLASRTHRWRPCQRVLMSSRAEMAVRLPWKKGCGLMEQHSCAVQQRRCNGLPSQPRLPERLEARTVMEQHSCGHAAAG